MLNISSNKQNELSGDRFTELKGILHYPIQWLGSSSGAMLSSGVKYFESRLCVGKMKLRLEFKLHDEMYY